MKGTTYCRGLHRNMHLTSLLLVFIAHGHVVAQGEIYTVCKFHPECKLCCLVFVHNFLLDKYTEQWVSIKANYWVSWLCLTNMNTGYQNCLEFVILGGNR